MFIAAISKHKAITAGSLLCLIVSFFVPVVGFAGFIVVVTMWLLRYRFLTMVEAGAIALTLFCVAVISLYSFITFCGLSLPVTAAPGLLYGAVLLAYCFSLKTEPTKPKYSFINRGDLYCLLGGVVCLFFILIPVINASGSKSAQFLSYGEDNASHYALTNYAYQNGHFAYRTSPNDNGIYKSLEIYPQGFHITAATFIGLVKPLTIGPAGFVKLYALFIAAAYSFFAFWLIKIAYGFLSRRHVLLEIALLPGYFLLGVFGYAMLLLDRGFQSQIFTYVFVFAFLFLLSALSRFQDRTVARKLLPVILFSLIGVSTSWWLLLPMLGICLLFYFFEWWNLGQLKRYITRYWLLLVMIVFVIVYPIVVNILLNQKTSPINEPGGVDQLPAAIFWYILPCIIVGLPFLIKKHRIYKYLLLSWLGALLLTAAIAAYQEITIGQFRYFFYKSVYTLLIMSYLVGFVAIFEVFAWLSAIRTRLVLPVLIVLLLVATTVLAVRSNLVFIKVYVHNWFPNAVQPDDLSVLFDGSEKRYADTFFVGGCQIGRSYLANRWSGARLLTESPAHTSIELAGLDQKQTRVAEGLAGLPPATKPYRIITYTDCPEKLPDLTRLDMNRFELTSVK